MKSEDREGFCPDDESEKMCQLSEAILTFLKDQKLKPNQVCNVIGYSLSRIMAYIPQQFDEEIFKWLKSMADDLREEFPKKEKEC